MRFCRSACSPRSRAWLIAVAGFAIVFAVLPLAVVIGSPGLSHEAFVCEAEVENRLATTLGGKLEFVLVRGLAGRYPADRFVVAVDRGFTAGMREDVVPQRDAILTPGAKLWLEGSLMDRDVFYGEQYLFFGYPQLYAAQVKAGLLWPSQLDRLARLYLSPFAAVGSFYLVAAYPFMEEYSAASWLLLIARLVLLGGSIAGAILLRRKIRNRPAALVSLVGLYALFSIALALPDL